MKTSLSIMGLISALILVILIGCSKDSQNPSGSELDQLKGGTWVEYKRENPAFIGTMQFRFYGDSNVTYTFISSYVPLKYDSIPNAKWRLFQPDTLRFYRPTTGAIFGTVRVLKVTDTILYTKVYGYGDTTLFKRN